MGGIITDGHLIVKCGFSFEGEYSGLFDDSHEESASSAFNYLDELLELNIGGP